MNLWTIHCSTERPFRETESNDKSTAGAAAPELPARDRVSPRAAALLGPPLTLAAPAGTESWL